MGFHFLGNTGYIDSKGFLIIEVRKCLFGLNI